MTSDPALGAGGTLTPGSPLAWSTKGGRARPVPTRPHVHIPELNPARSPCLLVPANEAEPPRAEAAGCQESWESPHGEGTCDTGHPGPPCSWPAQITNKWLWSPGPGGGGGVLQTRPIRGPSGQLGAGGHVGGGGKRPRTSPGARATSPSSEPVYIHRAPSKDQGHAAA